jgi:ribokinase
LGSANLDLTMRVSELPRPGETVIAADLVSRPGGKGANQAVAAVDAGANAWFAGCVGADAEGAALSEDFAAAGVGTAELRTASTHRTGTAVVLVGPTGENLIAVYPGANHALTPADVDGFGHAIAAADVLLTQLEIPIAVVEHALLRASEAGTVVILNLSPPAALSPAALGGVDILVVNRPEAEYLLGRPLPDERALSVAAGELRQLGPRAVVLTAGDAGAFYASDQERTVHLEAVTARVVDTTGAGDAFAGALAAEISRGATLARAVEAAIAAGGAAVQWLGARRPSGRQ